MQTRSPIVIHRQWWDFVYPLLDAVSIFASLAAIKWFAYRWVDDFSLTTGLVAVIVFLLASQLTGLHRRFGVGSPEHELIAIATTWAVTFLVLALLAFATRYGQHFSRMLIFLWCILAPAIIGLGRMSLRLLQAGLRRRNIGVRRVAIAGLNPLGRQTAANILQEASLGLRVTGFYDDRPKPRTLDQHEGDPVELAGDLDALVRAAQAGEIETVLIALPMRAEARIRSLLARLSDSTASVYIVPDFFVFELLHSRWFSIGGLPTFSVFENPLFGVDGAVKRSADLAVAIAALLTAAIPMLLIAIAVKATSPGPIIFRQRRYGLDGREIRVWKFRSMTTCDDGATIRQAIQDDPRITPVGSFLRKTSLDELPQLFNVVEGSMSLVGPRPHASAHNEQYRSQIHGYMLRHKVKPGITGLAQVNGCRGETETVDKMQKRIEWDHHYIRSWSLWLDIKILLRTVVVVWKQPDAY